MKFPESTASTRSLGSRASSSRLSTRGSMVSSVDRSSIGMSIQRPSVAMRRWISGRRYRDSGSRKATRWCSACAVSPTSPVTPSVTTWFTPSADSSSSTCTTVVPGPIRAPCRVVHMVRLQPQATNRSAPAINSAASGVANPPEMPRSYGSPSKSTLRHRRRGQQRAAPQGQIPQHLAVRDRTRARRGTPAARPRSAGWPTASWRTSRTGSAPVAGAAGPVAAPPTGPARPGER